MQAASGRLAVTATMMPAAPATISPTAAVIPAVAPAIARTIQARNAMPARVGETQRIVAGISIAVEGLGVARGGNERVRLGKTPEQRVIPSCVVKVQARARLVTPARKALGGEVAERAAGGRLCGWQGAGADGVGPGAAGEGRVLPSCVVKVQARARLVIPVREALGGESAEGAAGGRLCGWQGAGEWEWE